MHRHVGEVKTSEMWGFWDESEGKRVGELRTPFDGEGVGQENQGMVGEVVGGEDTW